MKRLYSFQSLFFFKFTNSSGKNNTLRALLPGALALLVTLCCVSVLSAGNINDDGNIYNVNGADSAPGLKLPNNSSVSIMTFTLKRGDGKIDTVGITEGDSFSVNGDTGFGLYKYHK